MMPLGLPVVPDVYSRKRGCSESNASGVCSVEALSTVSCHHRSRPGVHCTSIQVRCTTRTFCTHAWPATASSTASLSDTAVPRRYWPSVVMTILACASSTLARSAAAENPANTTECMMPNRAQANMATIASGTIGI